MIWKILFLSKYNCIGIICLQLKKLRMMNMQRISMKCMVSIVAERIYVKLYIMGGNDLGILKYNMQPTRTFIDSSINLITTKNSKDEKVFNNNKNKQQIIRYSGLNILT
jgi:hypothetical protein